MDGRMSLTKIAKQLSTWETRHVDCIDIDVQVKRLSLVEMQEAERLTESCSLGNGQNRHVNNLPKLVWTMVGRWFRDVDGNPLAGDDSLEDAKEWPSSMVSELMTAFSSVNTASDPDPN